MYSKFLGRLFLTASFIPLAVGRAAAASSTTTTMKLIDTPLAAVVGTGGRVNLIRTADNTWQATDNSNCPDGAAYPNGTAHCFAAKGDYTAAQVYQYSCRKHTCSADTVWNPASGTCIPIVDYGCTHTNNFMTLQDWDGCSALATPAAGGNNYTAGPCLIDNRDGKTYNVRKFADGKCWLANNLKFGGDYHYWHNIKGQSADTCALRLGSKWQSGGFNNLYTNQSAAKPPTNRFWQGSYGDCVYPYSSTSSSDASNKYGYLYNWMAAVQSPCGWYSQECDPDAMATNTDGKGTYGTQKIQGICPEGWHLPTGGTGGEFNILTDRVAGITGGSSHLADESNTAGGCYTKGNTTCGIWSDTSRNGGNGSYVLTFFNPGGGFNTTYAGRTNYIGESGATETTAVGLIYQGSNARYWSSTARSTTNAYGLDVYSSGVRPLGYHPGDSKYYGFSVRCVLD